MHVLNLKHNNYKQQIKWKKCTAPLEQKQGKKLFFSLTSYKRYSPKLVLFHKCFSAQHGRISFLLPKCAAWLHWKLVCLWQFHGCFRFAVVASEIVTVISSNSWFISFWRSFRGIFWEVLWTLKLTQSQVGIVGLKIVNSFNRINRCIKFRKRNRLLVTFVVFFTALWTFLNVIL